ncbi:MAG: hypothetical protein CL878_02690 [Dehalococcoidia bacterium]|nr:hypothetical protein [Dehalococcoidia bacterium]
MVAITGSLADRMGSAPRSWRGWQLWLWWVLATTVGWSAGGAAGGTAGWGLSRDIAIVGYSAGAGVGGIAAGLLQWLVLRRQVARASRWVLASTGAAAIIGVVGVAVGATLGFGVRWIDGGPETTQEATSGEWVFFVLLALYGTVLGVLQWLVLRRHVARAGWWVLASTGAWPLSIGVGAMVLQTVIAVTGVKLPAVAATLIPALYGTITGTVLVWLLRRPAPAAATEE